jgi:hypothetical protein
MLTPEIAQQIERTVQEIEKLPADQWLDAVLYFLSRFDEKDQSWEARDGYTRLVLEPLRRQLAIRIQQDRW